MILPNSSLVASLPPQEYTGFLQELWTLQRVRYQKNWQLYTGERWAELNPPRENQPATSRKFRLGVNDISLACNMHAQLLFGEVRDSSDPLVSFKIAPRRGQTVDDMSLGKAQDFLDELWIESLGRKEQFIAGLSSQVTGGVFWRVRYAGRTEGAFDLYPFKFEFLHSDYVFPVFSPGSTRMGEVFVRYQMPKEAARAEWGVWNSNWPDLVEYQEHWTADRGEHNGTLSITIGVDGLRESIKAERNPFGFVPFVYIPHIPANGFFGIPLSEWAGASDLAEEYNMGLANTGDILRQNSYPFGVLINHPTGKIKLPFRLWKDGPTVIDLGQGLDNKPPTMEWFKPSEMGSGSSEYLSGLKQELRMSMGIPPVAVGEDEGSQRSSLTLVTRMFPVKSHVTTERWMWGPPMDQINRMALQMAKIKKIAGLEDIDVSKLTAVPNWSPMLPKDRSELVNELVQRSAVGHIHPEDALEQYEDVPVADVPETFRRIQEYQKWQAELNKPEPAPDQGTKDQKTAKKAPKNE